VDPDGRCWASGVPSTPAAFRQSAGRPRRPKEKKSNKNQGPGRSRSIGGHGRAGCMNTRRARCGPLAGAMPRIVAYWVGARARRVTYLDRVQNRGKLWSRVREPASRRPQRSADPGERDRGLRHRIAAPRLGGNRRRGSASCRRVCGLGLRLSALASYEPSVHSGT